MRIARSFVILPDSTVSIQTRSSVDLPPYTHVSSRATDTPSRRSSRSSRGQNVETRPWLVVARGKDPAPPRPGPRTRDRLLPRVPRSAARRHSQRSRPSHLSHHAPGTDVSEERDEEKSIHFWIGSHRMRSQRGHRDTIPRKGAGLLAIT